MNDPRLLIVDDEPDMRWVIRGMFEDSGFEIAEANDGAEALAAIGTFHPDVILTDVMMPNLDGRELLHQCLGLDPDLPVILISAIQDIAVAVDAMKEGAFDYLPKPFDSERLLVTTRRAAEQYRLRREVAALRGQLATHEVNFGRSDAAVQLARTIDLVARQDAVAVLLTGESGTGKEVAAREIHRRSHRHQGPFVAIDCGALPEQLMESQLFGHRKGAFTGADRDRPGLFRMADGGTLFLDELGNLPLGLQAKLLRALQERVVAPVGGGDPVPFDARLVSATNSELRTAIDRGAFRLDLYHRICEFEVPMPPLRERPEDIPAFAEVFLLEANRDMGRQVENLTAPALATLQAHPWPGNMRELRNAIRRAMVVCGDHELDIVDLQLDRRAASPTAMAASAGGSLPDRVRTAAEALEAQIIRAALEESGGNKAAAARALQIDYTTLHRKLKKHGLLTMAPPP